MKGLKLILYIVIILIVLRVPANIGTLSAVSIFVDLLIAYFLYCVAKAL